VSNDAAGRFSPGGDEFEKNSPDVFVERFGGARSLKRGYSRSEALESGEELILRDG
jgi:hypothetical protein